jgi:hypothetical protein
MIVGTHRGQEARGTRTRARYAFVGINDYVTIGCILYDGNIFGEEATFHCTIVPISGIHIFIGDQTADVTSRPAQTAIELDMYGEAASKPPLSWIRSRKTDLRWNHLMMVPS